MSSILPPMSSNSSPLIHNPQCAATVCCDFLFFHIWAPENRCLSFHSNDVKVVFASGRNYAQVGSSLLHTFPFCVLICNICLCRLETKMLSDIYQRYILYFICI